MRKNNKIKKVTLEDLAAMTAAGFENNATKMDLMQLRLNKLDQGQEDIKLRLDNVAYRFEVKDLEKRVEKLESKTGIQRNR